jgi:penicillin amidase
MRAWAIAGAVAVLAAGAARADEMSSAVRRDNPRAVEGLQAKAEIVLDHWGVPHIYAGSVHDAFFLQGYNAARDRLWQIDLWRKRGLGRLSASFGPAYVAQDRAARLFLYRGDMAAEWASYAPGAKDEVEAFAAGINAYVAEVKAGKRPLPMEFRLTHSDPEAWKPEDVIRIRSHALVSNVTSEVARAQTICAGGLPADRLRRKLEPAHAVVIPKGLDPCVVTPEVLKDYVLATEQVSFDALAKPATKQAAFDAPTRLAALAEAANNEGSNNWTISPARSATGRPIVANDPHRQVGVPSLRYVSHLEAPGLSIIGAGEPALPGISLGHNADMAFGITIFYIDQEDLYVYETKGQAYRYKGGWEPFRTVHETIEVKGEAPREVELHFTRHGPVLSEDPGHNRAFAMRTVWLEPGSAGYFQSSWFWRAHAWDDFETARKHWAAPPLNLVYGDTHGDIGWAAGGMVPNRPNWDGLTPVPGDGRYEWAGFLKPGTLPERHNPPEGFVATANQMNLPADWPAGTTVSYEWADRSRITRIDEVLGKLDKSGLHESMALQTDFTSPQTRRAAALLKDLHPADAEVARAAAQLAAWNGAESTASPAAALYETWANKHLPQATTDIAEPQAAAALKKAGGGASLEGALTFLESPDAAPVRDQILTQSLAGALAELKQRLGPDMAAWRWGALHHAQFDPAIAVLADKETQDQLRTGPLEIPGSASTPRAATYRPSDFQQTAGASVRLVMDVGGWDNSVFINTPGQSGDAASVHYRDLFPLWAAGSYAPLSFSRAAVERNAEVVMSFTPKTGS